MSRIIILSLLFVSAIACADSGIYRWQDGKGNTVYSDQPQRGAKQIKLKPLQTFKSLPTDANSNKPLNKQQEKKYDYSALQITSPAPNVTFHNDSEGKVLVVVNAPKLESRHELVLTMDGAAVNVEAQEGENKNEVEFLLENVFRGTHILVAEIRDQRDEVIAKSSAVPFYMQLPTIRRRLGDVKPAKTQPLADVTAPKMLPITPKQTPWSKLSDAYHMATVKVPAAKVVPSTK